MNESLAKSIIHTRKILRDKFKSIKIGAESTEAALEKTFRPITRPINELLIETKPLKVEKHSPSPSTSHYKNIERKLFEHDASTPIKKESFHNVNKDDENLFRSFDNDDIQTSQTLIDNRDNLMQENDSDVTSDELSLSSLKNKKELDLTYGLHENSRGEWMFGKSKLNFIDDNRIQIGNNIWILTPGLFNLLFHKSPTGYDSTELSIYKKILLETNAHRQRFSPKGAIKGSRALKYKNIIKSLVKTGDSEKIEFLSETPSPSTSKKGSGLMKLNLNPSNYIYWDNPNELVNRLRLLISSQSAGHNNHNNEIISIVEELKEANIIE